MFFFASSSLVGQGWHGPQNATSSPQAGLRASEPRVSGDSQERVQGGLTPAPRKAPADYRGEACARDGVLSQGLRRAPEAGVMETPFVADCSGKLRYAPRLQPAAPVLAFDIETTGLEAEFCDVTCACAYDPDRGVERSFVFALGDSPGEFMSLLDEAPLLCAFNGVRFDIPFMCKKWGVSDERAGKWVKKMLDPFEACKVALAQTFSLNRLLAANGLQAKTGSGLDAVNMAREARWTELAEYCMHDTRMTHAAVMVQGGATLPLCEKQRYSAKRQ